MFFFVDCVSGWYGSNCNSKCSEYCAQISCNRSTAECTNGCKPGYYQPQCNERKIQQTTYTFKVDVIYLKLFNKKVKMCIS